MLSCKRHVKHLFASVILLVLSAVVGSAMARSNDLADLQQQGQISFAFYNGFAPFSSKGKGADVEIAEALAGKLGLKMSALWFDAGENMEDDLRNMVWKGHYLGYGPADVMIHVPIDNAYMSKIGKVKFFAPYYRERFAIARNLDRIPELETLAALENQPVGVEGDSLPATVLLGADAGKYRNTLKMYKTTEDAVAALKTGEVAAVLAQQGELEGGLGKDKLFAIESPPIPALHSRQWPLGLAVKAENEELAKALQKAMNELLADGSIDRIMAKHSIVHRRP